MNDTKNMIEEALRVNHTLNEISTFLQNKIKWFELSLPRSADKVAAYRDCLSIIEKEIKLTSTCDSFYDALIKKYKNDVIDAYLQPDKYRGTKEYMVRLKEAGKVADILENICHEMFNLGQINKSLA